MRNAFYAASPLFALAVGVVPEAMNLYANRAQPQKTPANRRPTHAANGRGSVRLAAVLRGVFLPRLIRDRARRSPSRQAPTP
jgi:hypothetical protein